MGVFSTFSNSDDSDEWEEENVYGNGNEMTEEPMKRRPGRPRKTNMNMNSNSNSDSNSNAPLSHDASLPVSPQPLKAKPGYYVLDPSTQPNAGGLHKYVYYGSSPPPDMELGDQVFEETE